MTTYIPAPEHGHLHLAWLHIAPVGHKIWRRRKGTPDTANLILHRWPTFRLAEPLQGFARSLPDAGITKLVFKRLKTTLSQQPCYISAGEQGVAAVHPCRRLPTFCRVLPPAPHPSISFPTPYRGWSLAQCSLQDKTRQEDYIIPASLAD